MPVHFGTIAKDDNHQALVVQLLQNRPACDDGVVASEDGRIQHVAYIMRDQESGCRIGKIIYTYRKSDESGPLETIDIDIMLDSAEPIDLQFLNRLPESSDANEYYDVETVTEGQRLQIETVNRNYIHQDILDTVQSARACAFPFALTVFDDIDALNDAFGAKRVKVGGKDMTIGFSETFAAPGSISGDKALEGEVFSLLIGTVKNFRDVTVAFGDQALRFTIVQVETALGLLPTAMGREVFDLDKLAPGKVLAMYADVKVDFAVDQ